MVPAGTLWVTECPGGFRGNLTLEAERVRGGCAGTMWLLGPKPKRAPSRRYGDVLSTEDRAWIPRLRGRAINAARRGEDLWLGVGIEIGPGGELSSLLEALEGDGIEVVRLPSVSPADVLLSLASFDPLSTGLQWLQASQAAVETFEAEIHSGCGLLITGFPEIQSLARPAQKSRFAAIARTISATYGHDAELLALFASTGLSRPPRVEALGVKELSGSSESRARAMMALFAHPSRTDATLSTEDLLYRRLRRKRHASNATGHRPRLTFASAGFLAPGQVTRSSLRACQNAERVFVLGADSTLPRWARERLRNVSEIRRHFRSGEPGWKGAERAAGAWIRAALQFGSATALLYGCSVVGFPVALAASRCAREMGIEVSFLPGVSAFDLMRNELFHAGRSSAVALFDANALQKAWPGPSPEKYSVILFQAGVVGLSTFESADLASHGSLTLIETALRRRYPPGHRVIAFAAPSTALEPAFQQTFSLCELAAQRLPRNVTLLLPAIDGSAGAG